MGADDAYLQNVYRALRTDLSSEAQRRTARVHVYPSNRCTYTIAKERIFVKVRDEDNTLLPPCVLRYVLCTAWRTWHHVVPALHEIAHTINQTQGHDAGFRRWFRPGRPPARVRARRQWLRRDGAVSACGHRVPVGYARSRRASSGRCVGNPC